MPVVIAVVAAVVLGAIGIAIGMVSNEDSAAEPNRAGHTRSAGTATWHGSGFERSGP